MDRDRARELLGVGPSAGVEQVKAAFRSAVMRHHPDRGGDPQLMRQLLEAVSALTNHGGTTGVVEAYRRRRGLTVIAQNRHRRRNRKAAVTDS